MDEIELNKKRMRLKRRFYTNRFSKPTSKKINKYITNLISRCLIAIILFFGIIIFTNISDKNTELVKENVLKNNMSFTKIYNIYNKFFGKTIPITKPKESETVFNETFSYESIEPYKDGYSLTVTDNYLVPIIESGIVVFKGEKEGYGNTIIIQGIDEVDYWYSDIEDASVSLYDYVTKGMLLGSLKGSELNLVFQKNGEYLGFDEVME